MEMTCILCPMGCQMTVTGEGDGLKVEGNACARGPRYARQEYENPLRVITSSIGVDGSEWPRCPVKTADAVPKRAMDSVIREIRAVRLKAPVALHQVILKDVAGTGVDVIATDERPAKGA